MKASGGRGSVARNLTFVASSTLLAGSGTTPSRGGRDVIKKDIYTFHCVLSCKFLEAGIGGLFHFHVD